MAMIEVDLLDGDGVIQSIGAVDDGFWNAYGGSAAVYAAQHGAGVYVPGSGPPATGSAERNIYQWADFTTWVSTVSTGVTFGKKGSTASSTGPSVAATAALVGVGVLSLVVAWYTLLKPKKTP